MTEPAAPRRSRPAGRRRATAPRLARSGPDVDDQVGRADDRQVVLDDDDGVARVAEPLDDRDQPADVVRVKADGRLVEHVERVDQPRAERGGQRHALGLAAGEGPRRAVEGQVIEADPFEVVEPVPRLRQDLSRDGIAAGARPPIPSRNARASRTLQGRERGDVEAADLDRQRLGPQPRAAAGGARGVAPPAAQEDADVHLVRLPLERLEEPAEAAESRARGHLRRSCRPAPASAARTGRRSAGRARGRRSSKLRRARPDRPAWSRGRSRRRGSIFDGSGTTRSRSRSMHPAEPLARRAGAERVVVAEEPGVGLGIIAPAARRTAGLGRTLHARSSTTSRQRPEPLGERRLDRVEPPLGGLGAADQAVDDHVDRAVTSGQAREPAQSRVDDLPADADPREPVLAERIGQGRAVRLGADVEREGDQVARAGGQGRRWPARPRPGSPARPCGRSPGRSPRPPWR